MKLIWDLFNGQYVPSRNLILYRYLSEEDPLYENLALASTCTTSLNNFTLIFPTSGTETGIIYGDMRHLGDDADPEVFLKTFPIISILSKMPRRYNIRLIPHQSRANTKENVDNLGGSRISQKGLR